MFMGLLFQHIRAVPCPQPKPCGTRTAALLDWLTQKFRRIGGSQVVEDGVMRGRRAEGAGANTIMAADRVYHTLVERQVLGKVHRYAEAVLTLEWHNRNPKILFEITQAWDVYFRAEAIPRNEEHHGFINYKQMNVVVSKVACLMIF